MGPGAGADADAAGAAVPGQPARPGAARPDRRALQLPRSTAYHLVNAMIAEGFVIHLPDEHRYGLGVAAFEVGSGYTRQAPLQRIARRPLADLVDRTGQTRAPGRAARARRPLRPRGARPRPAAAGHRRRRPAARPPDRQRPGDPGGAAARPRSARSTPTRRRSSTGTAPAPRTPERAPHPAGRDPAARLRHRGGRGDPGLLDVAAPVLDHNGHPVAGLALTFADGDTRGARRCRAADAHQALSRRLGGLDRY